MDLGESSQTFPGLRLFSPNNRLSARQDKPVLPVRVPSTCSEILSIQGDVQSEVPSLSCDGPAGPSALDPSASGNITIPRPHGRKTPELGAVLAPPSAQCRSKVTGFGEGRTTSGAQEFRQALSMTKDGDLLMPARHADDNEDLISLLDPLNSSSQSNFTTGADRADATPSSANTSGLQHRPYSHGLPPFSFHPHLMLNPFASSVQHCSPTVSGNPFSAVYRPPPGTYMHHSPQPLPVSTLPGLYRQHSPSSSTLPTAYGPPQSAAAASSGTPLPRSFDSSHALYSPVDSSSVFSSSVNTPERPAQLQADGQKSQDPFGDLLSMARPVTPQKMKVEDLRRKWETFE